MSAAGGADAAHLAPQRTARRISLTSPANWPKGGATWWQWADSIAGARTWGRFGRGRVARAECWRYGRALASYREWMLCSPAAKTRGYSGDFDMMDAIYDNQGPTRATWSPGIRISVAGWRAVRNRAATSGCRRGDPGTGGATTADDRVGGGPARDVRPVAGENAPAAERACN